MTFYPRRSSSTLPLLFVALAAVTSATACGGNEDVCACPFGGDAGPIGTPPAGDAAPDAAPVAVVTAYDLQIQGVTDGGQIVYLSLATHELWAVPFTGGVPTKISPPGFATQGDAAYSGGGVVFHHLVLMSMTSLASGQSSATAISPVSTWDERTGVTTTFAPAPHAFGPAWYSVTPDLQYVGIEWNTETDDLAGPLFVSRVDGSGSVSLGAASYAAFDQDWLVYSTLASNADGTPGASLVAVDGAHGWSSVTLSTNASGVVVDAVGSRALVANGSYPNGGQGVFLAPLDGSPPMVLDPTGGGPLLYLSPDSTFAMYTAAAGTTNAHVEAVTLPVSGPPGVPYAVTASALSGGPAYLYQGSGGSPYSPAVTVLPNAPTGAVAFFRVQTTPTGPTPLALVGVGAGATAPNLTLPMPLDGDAFTIDQSHVVITRPDSGSGLAGTLTSFTLPNGPESAPLSTTSGGWLPIAGSSIVFTDDAESGWGALRVADVATGTSSTLVAPRVFSFDVSPDKTRLAYTDDYGLWVAPVPSAL